jgi:ankyrin repeat protein
MLIDSEADVNAQGEDYGTALQAASMSGHDKIVERLLEKGADVNVQSKHYGTAL